MIEDTQALAEAVRKAKAAGAVGIDTEFVWSRTYYPTLGVVQIGYPDGTADLVDAPAIRDWSPFASLMADPATIKILHDAQQDLVILHRVCGALPAGVFDTQRAAGFVGLSSTISLRDLLKRLLKVRVAKTETQSDWLARPLSAEQVEYAKDDVRHAPALREAILERAEKSGRAAWIEEEMRFYEALEIYEESDPDLEMPRVRGSGALSRQQRDILRALGAWRERRARRKNLPRQFVLSDEAIVGLTKRAPEAIEALKPVKGLSERVLKRHRDQIWKAIERGRSGELPELANGGHNGPSPDEGFEARVDLALAYVKGTCLAAEMDPALIGNRAEITALVLEADAATPETHRILSGWRGAFCGNGLLELLQGRGHLMVDPKTGLPRLV